MKSDNNTQKAVIYCRVSDKAQEKKGSGLASQEACAREYCRTRGYTVVNMFREVLTGGETNRPVMGELLSYLRKNRQMRPVVVIDDLSRFARDVIGYPYYHCPKRGCESYGKSIRRDVIEGEFETLLHALEPTENLFRLACATFKDEWDKCSESRMERSRSLRADLAKIVREAEQFLDRIADAQTPSVINAYENRIRKLEEQKIIVSEKIASCGRALPDFEQSLRTALDFLGNPSKTWASERLEDKRIVLKLAFVDRLAYVRKQGFRTPNLTLPFKALADFSGGKIEMAHRRG